MNSEQKFYRFVFNHITTDLRQVIATNKKDAPYSAVLTYFYSNGHIEVRMGYDMDFVLKAWGKSRRVLRTRYI